MRVALLLPAVALLAGCSNGEAERPQDLMEVAEKSVTLPTGALPFDRYSRYFAERSDGRITARYIIHSPTHLSQVRDLCRAREYETFPCDRDGGVQLAEAGHRMWLDDIRDLPTMYGGGCAQIEFVYDPASRMATKPGCNGDY